ncbi:MULTISPECIES: helix-turn-helix domain-containing protein [Robertmurraya]|nr:helix-turn-helix domain-containing protein [Robertmurraya siralis]
MFSLGQAIRELRQKMGLSQKELASGICNQAQISNIEKNNYTPSAMLLNQISTKLGVDMNYFFEMQESYKIEYISNSKKYIRQLVRNRDYENLYFTILSEKKHPYYQEKENLQFILWHEAICIHYVKNNSKLAFEMLDEALHITNNKRYYTEQEMEILNSIAVIKRETGFFEESEQLFRKALKKLCEIPKITNHLIELKLLFGLAQLLTDIENYEESLHYCEKGIKICNQAEILSILGEFLYQRGVNLARLGNCEEARKSFEQSIHIFEIQNNTFLLESVKENQAALLGEKIKNGSAQEFLRE